MRLEVHSAADFLMNLIRVRRPNEKQVLSENQLESFKGSLQSLLVLRFRSHWYPAVPTKGSGYRCIRINGKMDPVVEQAGVAVGLAAPTLRKMLPTELTLWIDPEEVSYRIGENGSICVLYDSQSCCSPLSDIDSSATVTASPTSGGGGDGVGNSSGGEEFIMERKYDLQVLDYLERKSSQAAEGRVTKLQNSLGASSDDQYSPPMSPNYYQSTTTTTTNHHIQSSVVGQQARFGNFGRTTTTSTSYGNNANKWEMVGQYHANVRTEC